MLWLFAALAPVLVAVRCGQLGLPARGLVLSQLLLAAWLVHAGATRQVAVDTPRVDAGAAVSFAALTCLGICRLEGVSPTRWKQLLALALSCVALATVAGALPLGGRLAGGVLGSWVATAAVAGLLGAAVIGLKPRLLRVPHARAAQSMAWLAFAVPTLIAAATLPGSPTPLIDPLAFLPSVLLLGWVLAPAASPMRRASPSIDPVLVVEGEVVVDANESAYHLLGAPVGDLHRLRNCVQGMADLRRIVVEEYRECGEFFLGEGAAARECFEVRVGRSEDASEMRILTLQNATARRASERRLFHQAHFDSLTGLANRRYFVDRLGEALDATAAKGDRSVVLMYLDLDRFKEINDTYGHAAGDELLRIMAHRLRQHLRLDDCLATRRRVPPPSIARLGGDEFAILLRGIDEREDVERIADRVLRLVSEPVTLKGRKLWVAGSIGIAFYPGDGETLEELSSHADIALYHAKAERRSHFQFFHPSLTHASQRKASLDRQLRGAIEEGELSLHFQPKVTLDGGEIKGAEALLRWNSAEHGPVPPKEFIPVAEEFGVIGQLGSWVIDSACAQIAAWREQGVALVPISVNVSPVQFRQMNLLEVLRESFERHSVDPSVIEVELTESAVLEEGDSTIRCLEQLRAIGVRISLDDFGTGYSALSYLSTVPLDVLKLDRKFIRDIHLDPSAEGLVSGVVALAHSLNLIVVAEGVDCEEQIECLVRADCDLIQGFVFGPGVTAVEFAELLEWGLGGKPQPEPVRSLSLGRVGSLEPKRPEARTPAPSDEEDILLPAALGAASAEAGDAEEDEALLPALHGLPVREPQPAGTRAESKAAESPPAAKPEAEPEAAATQAASPSTTAVDAVGAVDGENAEDGEDRGDAEGAVSSHAAEAPVAEPNPAESDAPPPEAAEPAVAAAAVDQEAAAAGDAEAAAAGDEQAAAAEPEAAEDASSQAQPDDADPVAAAPEEPAAQEAASEQTSAPPPAQEPESVETIAAAEPASNDDRPEGGEAKAVEASEEQDLEIEIDLGELEDPETAATGPMDGATGDEARAEIEESPASSAEESSAAGGEGDGAAAAPEPEETASESEPEAAAVEPEPEPDAEATADESETRAASGEAVATDDVPEPLAASASDAAEREDERRVLVVGDGGEDIGLLALRLNRLDISAVYARDSDEGLDFAEEEGTRLGVLVLSAELEPRLAEAMMRRAAGDDHKPALVIVGSDPPKALLEVARGAVWVLGGPILDPELRFVFSSALTPLERYAQRKSPRAPFDVFVRMEISDTLQTGVLSSLSTGGCFVSCSQDIASEGSLVDLEFTLEDGPVSVVGKVLYILGEDTVTGAGIGLEFRGTTRELEERLAVSIEERTRCLA